MRIKSNLPNEILLNSKNRQGEHGHVKTEAEIGMMQLTSKEKPRIHATPEAGRGKETFSPTVFRATVEP